MRTSILARSAVAVATLAVGSVALAAVPAPAATATGVTREQVLTAVNGVRTAQANDSNRYNSATSRALREIARAGCDVGSFDDGEFLYLQQANVTQSGDDAEGVLITAYVQNYFGNTRYCTIAAFAPTDTSSTLSGTATVSGTRDVYDSESDNSVPTPFTQKSALSGDAFITPDTEADVYSGSNPYNVTAAAEGNATKSTDVTVTKRVTDKKTKAEKRYAKSKYDKRIKAAKKAYAKALDKAGKSKSEKAAAKEAYKAKRAAAKTTYVYNIAGYKVVKTKSTVKDVRPFSITTAQQETDNGPLLPSQL